MPIVPMSVPIASVGIVIPTVIVSILLGLVAGLAVLFIAIARTRSGGSVPADDRLMTAMGHLSGYGGYVIPIGGVLIPILLIMTAEDGGTVKAAAKQAPRRRRRRGRGPVGARHERRRHGVDVLGQAVAHSGRAREVVHDGAHRQQHDGADDAEHEVEDDPHEHDGEDRLEEHYGRHLEPRQRDALVEGRLDGARVGAEGHERRLLEDVEKPTPSLQRSWRGQQTNNVRDRIRIAAIDSMGNP